MHPWPVRRGWSIATGRFVDFHPSWGVPVRSTVGGPKFGLRYRLEEHAKSITPYGVLGRTHDAAEYEVRYRARLDGQTGKAIAQELAQIANRHEHVEPHRLVVLCFCDLSKPGAFCHRRMFAAWWEEHTGATVADLSPTQEALL